MSRPVVIETISALREALAEAGTDVALVPTMGALHEGHLALVDRARELAPTVVVSIFVNPLQFGANEDLAKYPRDLDADLDALEPHGVAFVFAPAADEMYPDGGTQVKVTGGRVAELFEGRSRPGHFDGVLTVVAKLLGIVRPQSWCSGRRTRSRCSWCSAWCSTSTSRRRWMSWRPCGQRDGLALSSRNRFLDGDARRAALVLSRALEAAASSGDRGIDAVLAAAQSVLMDEELVKLDYLKVVDPADLPPRR